ncbi:histidine phosphatase family protein [Paenibacillus sp. NFR01]|uniref:histidine phosphatase family protein n=1 Tax=Paenibacillus sp. NFR01 TaxID=1566279 RepID=UPI0008B4F5EB|nr:histidine phosphatase family protein [Paenibacillus sp. NFR01]SET20764.1 2,3-bisphosphoglycerate-dependent phosphoglycerate mutase [Paenibacillus sp. NFR01]
MITSIYMIRHGESPRTGGTEQTRGLSEKGSADAELIGERLAGEGIGIFVSSPYTRAVQTLEPLARLAGKHITTHDDLREQRFSGAVTRMPDAELMPLLNRCYADPDYALPDGESNRACQTRATAVLRDLLAAYPGQKIAIGTHGAVMALMMASYDPRYDLDFMLKASKPDVYRMDFADNQLLRVERLWT